jgi:RHS repeat-associated protein
VFRTATDFDALNRPIAVTAPDDSVIRPTYNEANLLERLEATLRGSATTTVFVNDVDYDANGQRRVIAYGNGVTSEREYDEKTFRLRRLHTLRGGESLQDLRYTYDPVGNITTITDQAQPTVYFDNAVVSADATYIYDAIYRLIEATGREHVGQLSAPQTSWKDEYRIHLPHPHDGQAMRRYTEHVDYDPVGNILALAHSAPNGSWTRSFTFTEPSQLQAGHTSNRLSTTAVGAVTEGHYTYDAHGNMTRVPHLPLMQWDYLDRLVASSQQVVQSGTPETTYYVYDGAGQRVRKVTERAADSGAAPSRKDERIYLGGFEVYREYGGAGTALQRESLHIVDGESRLALVETRVMGTDGSPPQLIRYQLGNLLGSAALELDDHGQIISYEEYYAYGSTSYQAGRSIAEVSLKRYRYIGKERDEETGLSYHGARYYAPWLGRWTAADRLGFSQPRRTDLNLYAYARGMPSRAVDLSGYAETDKTRAPVRIGKTEVYNPEDMEVVQVSESERVLLPKPGAKPRGTQPQSSRGSATKRPAETPPVPGMMGAPSTGQLQLPPRPGLPPDLRLPPPESTPPPAPVEPPGKVEAPRANPGTPGKIEAPPRIPGRVPLLGAVVAGIVLGFAIAAAEVLLFDNNTERVQQTERLFAQQYEERAAVVLAAGRRPHLRDSTVLKTWEEALKKGRGAVRDPSTREILDAPYYDENGKLIYNWHMGHKEGHEFWRLQIIAEEEGLTWKEVTEIYNDPSHYEPQLPEENISHENESPYVWILPNGRRVGK